MHKPLLHRRRPPSTSKYPPRDVVVVQRWSAPSALFRRAPPGASDGIPAAIFSSASGFIPMTISVAMYPGAIAPAPYAIARQLLGPRDRHRRDAGFCQRSSWFGQNFPALEMLEMLTITPFRPRLNHACRGLTAAQKKTPVKVDVNDHLPLRQSSSLSTTCPSFTFSMSPSRVMPALLISPLKLDRRCR